MTYNEKKTNRTFKSEQHALMTAALAQLKYTSEGYHTSSHNQPKEISPNHDYAAFEVLIEHEYGEDLQIAEYLKPSYIETRDYEPQCYLPQFRTTKLVYEYRY